MATQPESSHRDRWLDYRSARDDGTRRWSVVAIRVCAVLFVLLIVLASLEVRDRWRTRIYDDERARFRELRQLAAQMISDGAEGVTVDAKGEYFIASFEAFYRYVATKRPDTVSRADADNPFPGLLPRGRYGRLPSPARQPQDLLIWSRQIQHRSVGDLQMRITCGGRMLTLEAASEQ